MAYELRDNSGSLFNNDRKEQPNHADRQGTVMVGGVKYYINGWIKDGAKGKYLSLSFKPVDGAGDGRPRSAPRRDDPISSGRTRQDDMNDDIPF